MKRQLKILENGRLVVKSYPTKREFLLEKCRDDVDTWSMLHIFINHDTLSTIDLFELLKHQYPPRNVTKKMRERLIHKFLNKEYTHLSSILPINSVNLNERTEKDWEKTISHRLTPQIEIVIGDFERKDFDMWVYWCKKILKLKARWGTIDHKDVFNPYEGLRFMVAVEFHD